MFKSIILPVFTVCLLWGIVSAIGEQIRDHTNDTIFIQIWIKRTELEKLKKCDINSHVRVERPNDEYYILPCKAVKGVQ